MDHTRAPGPSTSFSCCAVCGRDAPPYTVHPDDGTDRCAACTDAPGMQGEHMPLQDALRTLPDGVEWDALSVRHVFPVDFAAAKASLPGPADVAATLLLDRTTWDLCLDANGNIAMATGPYAIAQDVASAVRLWHDTTKGVPSAATPPDHDWVLVTAAQDLSVTERQRHAELCEQLRAEALVRFRSSEWIGWAHWMSGPRRTRIPAWFWWRDVVLCPVRGDSLVPDTALWQGGGGFDRISVTEDVGTGPLPAAAAPELPAGRRGPKKWAAEQVHAAMLAWVADGRTPEDLRRLQKKQLPGMFGSGFSETTCFNARKAVLENLDQNSD